jgi:hypothetical protein
MAHLGLLLFSSLLLWVGAAYAQNQDPFAKACADRLKNIQDDRRVCVVAEVLDEKTLRVVAATQASKVGKNISATAIPPQGGQGPTPLKELSQLKGRLIVVGGFDNGDMLFSAKVL